MSDMNFLEKLLDLSAEQAGGAELEWKRLWEVTTWDKRFNAVDNYKQPEIIRYHYLLAKEVKPLITEGGSVKLLTTNVSNLWTTEELAGDIISEGEVVGIPWGGNPVVQYYKGKFLTSDNRIATSNDTNLLSNKYLYYFLLNNLGLIGSFYRGSGIKHPSMAAVLDMEIPIPCPNNPEKSLAIQAEIVRILDTFTELTTELTARKKQYNYYRDQLLTFEEGEVEWKPLGEVCDYVDYRGKTPKKTSEGVFLVTAKNIRMGYIDYQKSKEYISEDDYDLVMRRGIPEIGDILITTEAPCGFVAQVDRKNIALAQRVIKYRSKNKLLINSFLKHYLMGGQFQKKLHKTATGSTVKGIKGSKLHKLTIPIPHVSKQKEIVAILDKFDALTNSISEGLPREIKLRQKQYEYYRDLLLSFPKEGSTDARQ